MDQPDSPIASDRTLAPRTSRAPTAAACAACAGLLALCLLRHGRPLDAFTWTVLALLLLAALVAGLRKSRVGLGLVGGFFLYLALPDPFLYIPFLERWALFDDRGGREGTLLSPSLRFGHAGPNTALLESHLGPLEPNWWRSAPRFPHIRDGNERVDSRSMIRSANLPAILAMLPSDAARRQVLACLTDPDNRLRVHQGLLLACLKRLGYPAGYDAQNWWTAHEPVFIREPDPHQAVRIVYGWLEEVNRLPTGGSREIASQTMATQYHVRGSWGRVYDFGLAYGDLRDAPRQTREALPTGKVIWWPERQAAKSAD